ncbi:MAG: gliding motility protein GldL [Saprospiraceae bacterium]|nr:gliding motility protein GldL [Saprospiraceae bacterium]MBK8635981.1 gliding motility protein GldL [Saprospiraceae bacterium]MBP7644728.1 gliding motility protein GldL [Saprospiraceae bacterium]
MSFYKTSQFKYLKNLIIGVGAAVVMIGALGKINSYSWGGPAITAGLLTEAFLFLMLGLLPPDKDYYWEKLYPGLDKSDGLVSGGAAVSGLSASSAKPLNSDVVETNLTGMLSELQNMSKSLSSLKALQEVDFSETSEQLKTMHNFYTKMGEAMKQLNDTVDDTKLYKEQMISLNKNLSSLNSVYGNVLNAFTVKQN